MTVTKLKKEQAGNKPAPVPKPQVPKEPETLLRRVAGVLNSVYPQTALYIIFVFVFQSLTQCFRKPEEFLLDKHVMDRIVENHFDSSHNTFESIRRVADIYEWGEPPHASAPALASVKSHAQSARRFAARIT